MNPAFDMRTSKTLLEKLRVFEDRKAWSQFLSLYTPMMQAWGRRFGLKDHDVEELTGRLLAKLVEAIPRFDYDPEKGSFRGWLKTVTQREISNLARERRRRLPGEVATGKSTVFDMLFEHADQVDDLVDSLHERSQGMLRSVQDAMKEMEGAHQGEDRKSWELFQRIFVQGQAIEPTAAEYGLSYHAAAMRVQRIKKKVRSRSLELALQRGVAP
ncbi:MAG TPA: sigma-70 family RNA polymerase sigma factor [Gemmataceae bacterium]|nr:sigma-70 family RNA polymerase sigma factor [Gemmataceae bacterium]